MTSRLRIVFMGTPDFAVSSLERLIAEGHDVVGVFTQPDKPKGRNRRSRSARCSTTFPSTSPSP